MATHDDSLQSPGAFSPAELTALGLFYAGVRARVLRARFRLDPWVLLQRHRHLPHPEYGRARELADRAAARERAADGGGRFA